MADRYLLRASEIAEMPGQEKTHFLNANAQRLNRSLGDATGLRGLGVHLIEIQPGRETTEYHVHYHEDEAVYVLSGTATATIGDEDVAIGQGDFIGYRAGGLAHTIVNTGDVLLRLLVIGQRLPQDVGDYPRLGKRIYRQAGVGTDVAELDSLRHPMTGARK